MQRPILITGATGFVGAALTEACDGEGRAWIGQGTNNRIAAECFVAADFSAPFDLSPVLADVEAVVHLAGMAHVPARDGEARKRAMRINVEATAELAQQAVRAGVRRFIFVSSIKSRMSRAGAEDLDFYGTTKKLAEERIMAVASGTGMAVTVLRPCLMYGAGAKGNLASMMHWVGRGIPLPLGLVANRRSLMHVRNFADLILRCLDSRDPVCGLFSAVDGGVFSTPALLRATAKALGKTAWLFPFPPALLFLGARLLGRGGMAEKLLGDLVVDGSELTSRLGWRPPFTPEQGFVEMAAGLRGK